MNQTIAAIILTKDEEKHIERCISSLKDFCQEIWVVDSFSSDRTIGLAEKLGVKTVKHPFKNQAQQFNWAIHNCNIESDWIWRVDADEYISERLGEKVTETIKTCSSDVNGIYVNKKIIFMGTPLMHGGWYPAPQIKVIRRGFGASENKMMDEHLVVSSGDTIYINEDQTDENLNDIIWWSHKHVNYAKREAINMLMMAYGMEQGEEGVCPKFFGTGAERKRWLKMKYARSPLFIRPFLNFIARFIFKGGFLDGKGGFLWYILQGFWYRMLVDARIFEIKKKCHWNRVEIISYIEKYCQQEC